MTDQPSSTEGLTALQQYTAKATELKEQMLAGLAELEALAADAAMFPALDPNPQAVENDEFRAWFVTKELTDLFRDESGPLSDVSSKLRDLVQTYLWQRMEETSTPNRRFPELGVQFIQTHTIYPGLDLQTVAELGLSKDEANDQIIAWLESPEVDAAELVNREPQIVWARMRGKEFIGKWMSEGYVIPEVIRRTPKPTIQVRKL